MVCTCNDALSKLITWNNYQYTPSLQASCRIGERLDVGTLQILFSSLQHRVEEHNLVNWEWVLKMFWLNFKKLRDISPEICSGAIGQMWNNESIWLNHVRIHQNLVTVTVPGSPRVSCTRIRSVTSFSLHVCTSWGKIYAPRFTFTALGKIRRNSWYSISEKFLLSVKITFTNFVSREDGLREVVMKIFGSLIPALAYSSSIREGGTISREAKSDVSYTIRFELRTFCFLVIKFHVIFQFARFRNKISMNGLATFKINMLETVNL